MIYCSSTIARTLLALSFLLIPIVPAKAQRPFNLDFERPSVADSSLPWGWTLGWSAFAGGPSAKFSLDGSVHHRGRGSVRIEIADSVPVASPQPIMLQLPAAFARGQTVVLSGWVRTVGGRSAPLITLETWKDEAVAAADTARPAGRSDSTEWQIYRLRIEVPPDSPVHTLVVSLAQGGQGIAWFDDFTLELNGKRLESLPRQADPPTAANLAWLTRHATPLRSVMAGADAADLALVDSIVGSARVVGLGESTHGTREFFQVKHRILRHLVERLGFRVFAIEANQLAVERINQYIQGGPGSADSVMRVMFRVWNTEEMAELIDWLRGWNRAHPDRGVRFAGYDMQDHRTPADTLRAFLERNDTAMVGEFDRLVGEYRAQRGYATPEIADSMRARWGRQAEQLAKSVKNAESRWMANARSRDDSLGVAWAVQSGNLLRQAARFNVALNSPERDSLMAANLDWLLKTLEPGARAVLWAHDVHVSKGGDPAVSFNGGAQMGAYLSKHFGYDHRAFTLLTYDGDYSATRSFTDHRMIQADAFPGPAGSLEEALHRLQRPPGSVGWIADLRPARAEPAGAWLLAPRPIRHIGYAAYDYGFEISAILPLEFDGVIFVDRTTASRLTR